MRWCAVFTFHLPPDLDAAAVARMVETAYRPLTRLLLRRPALRGGLAIEAGTSERLWREGHEDVFIALRTLMERGQLEAIDTAAYGAPLPLLPEEESRRQLARNAAINRTYYGLAYRPAGVVTRACAASPALARIAQRDGYRYLLCDRRALPADGDGTAHLRSPGGLALISCDRDLAEAIADHTAPRVTMLRGAFHRAGDASACVLPVERLTEDPARLRRLVSAVERIPLRCLTPREHLTSLEHSAIRRITCEPDGAPWLLWHDPDDPVHRMQWRFISHARALAERDLDAHPRARELLDRALCADFLTAASPASWNRARIEFGAQLLLESVLAAASDEEEQAEARFYALEIAERARARERFFEDARSASAPTARAQAARGEAPRRGRRAR